jgi:hypothetical protein
MITYTLSLPGGVQLTLRRPTTAPIVELLASYPGMTTEHITALRQEDAEDFARGLAAMWSDS